MEEASADPALSVSDTPLVFPPPPRNASSPPPEFLPAILPQPLCHLMHVLRALGPLAMSSMIGFGYQLIGGGVGEDC